MAAAKNKAAHAVGVFKKIDRFPIGPVVGPGHFAYHSRHQKNNGKKPDVPPLDFLMHDFYLRNSFMAQIRSNTTSYDKCWKYPRRFKEKVSGHNAKQHDAPSDGIFYGNGKSYHRCIY